jgi:ABC-type dipeptide/oligopeptide/nickel transport system ATPase subunit
MNSEHYYNLQFEHPARWVIFGPSSSGKSTFVMKYLISLNELYDKQFDCIIYSSENIFPSEELAKRLKIQIIDKVTEDLINSLDFDKNNMIIFDDQMHDIVNDITISNLFTKKSHHKNITVIFLTQNLYPKSKYMRDISINSSYIVLMRNPVEILQIKSLSNRIDVSSYHCSLLQAYKEATKQPYSYLLVDLCQKTPEVLRFRSKIFPSDSNQIVYC